MEAKRLRTMLLWCALVGETRACYGAQDKLEWGQLEAQMEQQADQDEEYWKDAAYDARYRESMVFIGEKQRLVVSEEQMERFRRIAVDGKGSRFKAAGNAEGGHAGAVDKKEGNMILYGELL